MASTYETVAGIISNTCDIEPEKITPESHAINDLGIDSLDFLAMSHSLLIRRLASRCRWSNGLRTSTPGR